MDCGSFYVANSSERYISDEITFSTQVESYIYIVRETRIVEPTETWVLNPTDFAMTTLISCYPYRVNTQRIVVFADLMET